MLPNTERKKIRLGDLLVQNNLITDEQLGEALGSQKQSGKKLGRALIDLGMVEEDQLLNLLSQQLDVPFIQLRNFNFKAKYIGRVCHADNQRIIFFVEYNGPKTASIRLR